MYIPAYLAKISKHFFQRTLPVDCSCKRMTAEELETTTESVFKKQRYEIKL